MSKVGDDMVYLKEVSVGVELPHGVEFFIIKSASQAPFVAELDIPNKLPPHQKQYAKISLLSATVLEANAELRTLLEPLGAIHPTAFGYSLDAPATRPDLFIRDNDPINHRIVSIGCDCYNLRKGDTRSEAFRKAVTSSNFVQGVPSWESIELTVSLKSQYVHPSQLLSTFAALLTLFK